MASYPLPSTDISHINTGSPDQVFQYCRAVLDYLFRAPATISPDGKSIYPSLNAAHHATMYNIIFQISASSRLERPDALQLLYTRLVDYISEVSEDIAKTDLKVGYEGITTPGQNDVITGYLATWDRYRNRAVLTGHLFEYYDRNFVAREKNSRSSKTVTPDDIKQWGYPDPVTSKVVAETSALAAAEASLVPVRALILRKWRLNVVEKMDFEAIVGELRQKDADEGKELARAIRTSFLWVGVLPKSAKVVMLDEIAGDSGVKEAKVEDEEQVTPDA